ncbi:methyltransferase domain-containing protein [Streptomyces sp. HU2014]|uniref:methyltransferase domain-containing protein n=1 Tax=Streptomyces sp. HU2014 TaxID=2939414 RepID=UPI00200BFEF0|nr:methyltransferase domain-containing protein [Streptomyces sp. HU2014]UQI43872.1 methyltransferase domain-containing protein [Streptomyces sp. HU2014]
MTTQQHLVQLLEDKGALLPEWRGAVAAVDRARFIPEVFEGGNFTEDPGHWAEAVYADAPLVTQVNDGKPVKEDGFKLSTSSSSMPSIMLEMLGLLQVGEGHRVLEIGTGTGYHAAWLCHRLGDANVTSVEIDPAVLTAASTNLQEAGYRPAAVLGDGRHGHAPNAPYDRIICTCTMRHVPQAWLEQCPDGRIVTPWGSSFFGGSFVTVDVTAGTGRGSFSGDPAFMWDRTQRAGAGRVSDYFHGEEGVKGLTDIAPQHVIQDDPAFFIGIHLTDAWYRWCEADDDSGEATLWFFADDGKSWATVEYAPGQEEYEVEQYGPRGLWDEVRSLFLRWHALGRPERSHFGLTVDQCGQQVWLDEPLNVLY